MNTNSPNAPEPNPIKNNHPAVWDLVVADMKERDQIGLQKYNTRLQPFNGRDPLVDAYQESLDLVVYLRQEIYQREKLINALHEIANQDPIELILDPQWAARIASTTLAECDVFKIKNKGE